MADQGAPTPRPVASKPKPRGPLAKQAGNLKAKADEAIRLADPEALRSRLAFSDEHLDVLDQISSGLPVKNSVAILNAARIRLDFTMARPAQGIAVDQRVTYAVFDPYAEPGGAAIELKVTPLQLVKRADETANDYAERLVREREAKVIAERAKAL
jgi:hypothetical protein